MLWPKPGHAASDRTGHGSCHAGDMDPHQLTQALLGLVEQLDHSATCYTLAQEAQVFAQTRIVRGLLKPRSEHAYRTALAQVVERFGDIDITEDFVPHAAEWYAAIGKAVWRPLQILRALLVQAQRAGRRSSPHALGAVMRKAEYLPREAVFSARQLCDLELALEELDRATPPTVPTREVLRALIYTGCRVSEIAGLRVDEVRPGYLRLHDSKTGPRSVPLSNQAQLVIARQRARDGFVFPGRIAGRSVSVRAVQKAFADARIAAGLREGTVHTIRHSFATIAVRNGVPISALQKILGHKTASFVTHRYVHLDTRDAALGCAVVANAIVNGGAR